MDSRTIYAFLGGAAVGAGVALLLAPRSGDETRDMIRGTFTDAYGRVTSIPPAVSRAAAEAGTAARQAFIEAYQANTRA